MGSAASKPVSKAAAALKSRKAAAPSKKKIQRKVCGICTESKLADTFSEHKITSKCKHREVVCRQCMQTWCKAQMSTKNWSSPTQQIFCPICIKSMSVSDVETHASKESFEFYKKVKNRAEQAHQPEFFFCQSPHCSAGQLHEDSSKPMQFQQAMAPYDLQHMQDRVLFEMFDICTGASVSKTLLTTGLQVLYTALRKRGGQGHLATCPNHPDHQPPANPAYADDHNLWVNANPAFGGVHVPTQQTPHLASVSAVRLDPYGPSDVRSAAGNFLPRTSDSMRHAASVPRPTNSQATSRLAPPDATSGTARHQMVRHEMRTETGQTVIELPSETESEERLTHSRSSRRPRRIERS
ncbi:MAG: hypothetical protein Q9162_004372 [Coniocarpon cinnabarinum]